jgi:hypothetical protein
MRVRIEGPHAIRQRATPDPIELKDDLYVIDNDFVPGNVTALAAGRGLPLVDGAFAIEHPNVLGPPAGLREP